MRVIDFFCGAGGFSQGFKQMGFEIIYGYDNWEPAVRTFNYNYKLDCRRKNILDFHNNIEEIERIPNTEIIIGSPPCVSFSSSNKSGKADKSLGIKLTETFLQIIAIKKYQANSILKAWYMENVANSYKHLKQIYTFNDLNLNEWATENNIDPTLVAIKIDDNYKILNSQDFLSFQNRKRFIAGECIPLNRFVSPTPFTGKTKTLHQFKKAFISPFSFRNVNDVLTDPNYQTKFRIKDIADHFYDTGIHNNDIKFAKFLKTNHPYMGKMSFPENEDKPSRTITATLIVNSREAIIYKTEIDRSNGSYRLPTVREVSTIMGFPLNYQFFGPQGTKWRLIGNAVCIEISRSLATKTLEILGIKIPNGYVLDERLDKLDDLNTFTIKKNFSKRIKKSNAKFRWHILKDGNMTISLTNFNPQTKEDVVIDNLRWYTSIQYGTGEGFPNELFDDNKYVDLEEFLINKSESICKFIKYLNSSIFPRIGNSFENQQMFSLQKSINKKLELSNLLVKLNDEINNLELSKEFICNPEIFTKKELVPLSQALCFYIINKITYKINNHGNQ